MSRAVEKRVSVSLSGEAIYSLGGVEQAVAQSVCPIGACMCITCCWSIDSVQCLSQAVAISCSEQYLDQAAIVGSCRAVPVWAVAISCSEQYLGQAVMVGSCRAVSVCGCGN